MGVYFHLYYSVTIDFGIVEMWINNTYLKYQRVWKFKYMLLAYFHRLVVRILHMKGDYHDIPQIGQQYPVSEKDFVILMDVTDASSIELWKEGILFHADANKLHTCLITFSKGKSMSFRYCMPGR